MFLTESIVDGIYSETALLLFNLIIFNSKFIPLHSTLILVVTYRSSNQTQNGNKKHGG